MLGRKHKHVGSGKRGLELLLLPQNLGTKALALWKILHPAYHPPSQIPWQVMLGHTLLSSTSATTRPNTVPPSSSRPDCLPQHPTSTSSTYASLSSHREGGGWHSEPASHCQALPSPSLQLHALQAPMHRRLGCSWKHQAHSCLSTLYLLFPLPRQPQIFHKTSTFVPFQSWLMCHHPREALPQSPQLSSLSQPLPLARCVSLTTLL